MDLSMDLSMDWSSNQRQAGKSLELEVDSWESASRELAFAMFDQNWNSTTKMAIW